MTKLLILWLLSEGPLHGYRIKKVLDDSSLRFWFQVEVGSIYAALASLVKSGHIVAEAVEREGLRPERTRFRILKEGRAYYQKLLRQAWSEPTRYADPLQAALAARSDLSEEEVRECLHKRSEALRSKLGELDCAASSAPDSEMVSRSRALLLADLEWTEIQLNNKT